MTASVTSSPLLSPVFPVLVAITPDTTADTAIRVTHALAEECGAVPTVLRVVRHETEGFISGLDAVQSPEFPDIQRVALETQIHDILGVMPSWQYEVDVGTTVPTIVHRARELRAELVILGLPRHNLLWHTFVRDAMRDGVEQAAAAVLAVRPALTWRPRCILVAVDFSHTSLRAAYLACQLVAPGGQVVFVYVQPEVSWSGGEAAASGETAEHHVTAAITSLIGDLASRKTITVTSLIEYGSSLEEVKAAALRMAPDLIALGSEHSSALDWFFGESVSTALQDERSWSLLIVPG